MTRNALAPYLTDMGGYDQEQVPAQYMQPELRAYRPTWRDTLASWLMPDERASPEQSRLVEGLTGSRGIGNTGMGIVDFVPGVGNAFQAQEEGRKGEHANMAFAIFGGPAAKTANLSALSKAEMLAKQGAPREQIWNETGWFKGTDGKWRFEIDDSGAKLTPALSDTISARNSVFRGDASQGIDHPNLYAAYPDAASERMVSNWEPNAGGAYWRDADGGPGGGFSAVGPDATSVRSTALHELGGHGIQAREGFARGGASREFSPNEIAAEQARIRSLPEGDGWTSIRNASGDDPVMASFNLYRRLAGEVEARTVQKRLDYTPEQRASRPPWLDYDVPESDQIVRFGGSGHQLSTGNALSPRR